MDISPKKVPIAGILARWVLFLLFFAILVFAPAGTLNWPEGWAFLGLYAVFSLVIGAWLLKNNPGLLEERVGMKGWSARGWDMAVMSLIGALFIAIFVISGLGLRFHWPRLPLQIEALGFAGLALAFVLASFVMRENAFARRMVQVTKGQTVVSTGPYGFVRHPMYVGAIVFYICIPLAFGSLYGIIPALCASALFVVRTYMEDGTLQKELKGYEEYCQRTRYRLVPYVW